MSPFEDTCPQMGRSDRGSVEPERGDCTNATSQIPGTETHQGMAAKQRKDCASLRQDRSQFGRSHRSAQRRRTTRSAQVSRWATASEPRGLRAWCRGPTGSASSASRQWGRD